MDQDLTKLYLDSMVGGGLAKYLCNPGFIFSNSPAPARGEFERRYSMSEIRDAATQVLRYLATATYLDEEEIFDAAILFKKKKLLANVITDHEFLKKCIKKLVFLGAIDERRYVGYHDGLPANDHARAYCITERGAGMYKAATDFEGYIEEMLICQNPTEVMRRLATNYILQQMEYRTDAKVGYCYAEHVEAKKGRRMVYGRIESDKECVIFEPVFYRLNPNIQIESELEQHIDDRIIFLPKMFKKMVGNSDKRRVLVLVVEDRDCIKKAYQRYEQVIKDCDLVYITSEAMVRASIKMNLKVAPFLKIFKDPNREGNVKLTAATPPFMYRNKQ